MPELVYNSPVGPLIISINNQKVIRVKWATVASKKGVDKFQLDTFANETIKQLDNYFSGKTDSLGIKVQMKGTQFQKDVWESLTRIPIGETKTYSDIASEIGRPRAYRAVGSACARNKIPVIIPCHRVVGRNNVTGWSGNPGAKEWLLEHEKKNSTRE
jgi:methylated-DNA-[protein]-cysteine S-methyltransferase